MERTSCRCPHSCSMTRVVIQSKTAATRRAVSQPNAQGQQHQSPAPQLFRLKRCSPTRGRQPLPPSLRARAATAPSPTSFGTVPLAAPPRQRPRPALASSPSAATTPTRCSDGLILPRPSEVSACAGPTPAVAVHSQTTFHIGERPGPATRSRTSSHASPRRLELGDANAGHTPQ